MPRPRRPVDARFHESYSPEPNTGCWLWLGTINSHGYGHFMVWEPRKGNIHAHRFSWEMAHGPIPKGMVIDHKCRERSCVNPAHLRVVTDKENILCGESPSGKNARRTHCINGHPFDAANTMRVKKGRACRACGRDAGRRWRQTRKVKALTAALEALEPVPYGTLALPSEPT